MELVNFFCLGTLTSLLGGENRTSLLSPCNQGSSTLVAPPRMCSLSLAVLKLPSHSIWALTTPCESQLVSIVLTFGQQWNINWTTLSYHLDNWWNINSDIVLGWGVLHLLVGATSFLEAMTSNFWCGPGAFAQHPSMMTYIMGEKPIKLDSSPIKLQRGDSVTWKCPHYDLFLNQVAGWWL